MKKEDLLKYCRYYKGEKYFVSTDPNIGNLWYYERAWVEDIYNNRYNDTLIDEYIGAGLGLFSQFDGVPLTLQALIFNRYAKGCQSLSEAKEPFKKFYNKYYKREL